MYGWRFMAPVLPLLAISQTLGVESLASAWNRRWKSHGRGLSLAPYPIMSAFVLLTWLGPNLLCHHYSWRSINYSTDDRALISNGLLGPTWIATTNFIEQHTPPNALIAYSEMGYGPFVAINRVFLDTRGLTDSQVANMPGKYKSIVGVDDRHWMTPNDPLAVILVQHHPDFIIALRDVTMKYPPIVLRNYRIVATSIPNIVIYSRQTKRHRSLT